jgi:hypothetical protein
MPTRRRFKQQSSLQDRILEWASDLREQVAKTSPGHDREELSRKLQQAETAMRLDQCANSPGLQPPE